MKREEKEGQKQEKNQGDDFFGSESDNCGYGFEHDFFILDNVKSTEKGVHGEEQEKRQKQKEETKDQSKTFFLPDFFSHEE